ncbi:DNA 3'-5' helicase OS=Streptomyces griseomycini OX=66895 GN=FHS37_006622 PE=4 SV=1 [Streptomyces griseomycini]
MSRIGNRRGALLEAQNQRQAVRIREEQDAQKAREKADALARAVVGKKAADGSSPVSLDGEQIGTVEKLGSKWSYTHVDGTSSGPLLKSKADAVAGLVHLVDFRREQEEELARNDAARSETPDGWVLGDREDVAENDIIRVPRMRKDRDGRPYPEGWNAPVRVTRVERRDDGTTTVSFVNSDGSYAWGSPLFLRGPDDTFAWASDRTRPEPTPAWHHELRARMRDIHDDILTLRNHSEGIDDQDRIQRLQDLLERVEDGSEDLQADLRRLVGETAWLKEEFDNPDLPYETRRYRSWASAAHNKARRALEHPDFQQGSTDPVQDDEFAAVRQRYDGDMVPASEIRLGDWVHTVSADPAYNEPMHMVGRVIGVTPVLSNGQVRIEVEADVTLNGTDTVRAEFAMIRATDLVERLPEGNPGREDSSDLARRIEADHGRRRAAKVRVPEGWQAVDGSQIQPRPGDRFRIVARRGGGSGPNSGPEHMNITVERPAQRDGYWRVKNQPLSFRPSDIVAIPDGSDARGRDDDAPESGKPNTDGPGNAPVLGGQAAAAPDAGPRRFSSVDEVRDRWKRGDLDPAPHADMVLPSHKHGMRSTDADTDTLELSEGGRLAVLQVSEDIGPVWSVVAPGSMAVIARAYNRDDALAQARILEGVRDTDGNLFPWDAPDAAERALTFRGPDGESLGTVVAQRMVSQGGDEGVHSFWQKEARRYLDSKRELSNYYDEWRTRQEADGYTIPLNPLDTQAGDEITVLHAYPGPYDSGPRTAGITNRARLEDSARPDPLGQGAMFPFLVHSHWSVRTEESPEFTDEQADKTGRALIRSLRFRSTAKPPKPSVGRGLGSATRQARTATTERRVRRLCSARA